MGHKISKITNDAEAFTNSVDDEDTSRHPPNSSTVVNNTLGEEPAAITKIIHHSETHINTVNAPVIIGPFIHYNHSQDQIQTQASKTDYQQHLQECKESHRVIDNAEIALIAEKVEAQKLKDICQLLEIKENNLQDWLKISDELSPAYRMLYYWAQVQDEQATVQQLTKVFADCGQEDAILALIP